MHGDEKYGRLGTVLGAAALALSVSKQARTIVPATGTVSPPSPQPMADLIYSVRFSDVKPSGSDNKWANATRIIFDRQFSQSPKWGQQVIYGSPYTGLRFKGETDAADFEEFYLYGYVLHNGLWMIIKEIEITPLMGNQFDTGLIPISSLGIPGYSALVPDMDRVSMGALWQSDTGFQLSGYCDTYGGYV